jgi:hypothetical protein
MVLLLRSIKIENIDIQMDLFHQKAGYKTKGDYLSGV